MLPCSEPGSGTIRATGPCKSQNSGVWSEMGVAVPAFGLWRVNSCKPRFLNIRVSGVRDQHRGRLGVSVAGRRGRALHTAL